MPADAFKVQGTTPSLIRVEYLLRTYLTTFLGEVDTNANADLAAEDQFDSDALDLDPTSDFYVLQRHRDRKPNLRRRIVIVNASINDISEALADNEGTGVGVPRFHRAHGIGIVVGVRTGDHSEGPNRAQEECDRLKDAVRLILEAYPGGSVPDFSSGPLDRMWSYGKLVADAIPVEQDEQDAICIVRNLLWEAQRFESR